jgi:hypothetical protein
MQEAKESRYSSLTTSVRLFLEAGEVSIFWRSTIVGHIPTQISAFNVTYIIFIRLTIMVETIPVHSSCLIPS